jgi:uncharacterized membrane protein YhhN
MVVKRALVESRPYLALSLFAAISYYFVSDAQLPFAVLTIWKGLGVTFLAAYALRRHPSTDARLLAAVMACGALGDVLIEFALTWGAVAFMVGHVIAISLYARNRRSRTSFSQKAFAIVLVFATVFLAWALVLTPGEAEPIAFYALFLGVMAAMAWTSRFPRYRVGIGALLFVISDLLIFSRFGPFEESVVPDYLVWPTYYFGQFLICTGVIQTLRRDDLLHRSARVARSVNAYTKSH